MVPQSFIVLEALHSNVLQEETFDCNMIYNSKWISSKWKVYYLQILNLKYTEQLFYKCLRFVKRMYVAS